MNDLASASTASSIPAVSTATSLLLLTVAVRPFHILTQSSPTSSSSSTSSNDSSLLASGESLPKRARHDDEKESKVSSGKDTNESPLTLASIGLVTQILSIPMLCHGIIRLGLIRILPSFVHPNVWIPCMNIIHQRQPSCSSTAMPIDSDHHHHHHRRPLLIIASHTFASTPTSPSLASLSLSSSSTPSVPLSSPTSLTLSSSLAAAALATDTSSSSSAMDGKSEEKLPTVSAISSSSDDSKREAKTPVATSSTSSVTHTPSNSSSSRVVEEEGEEWELNDEQFARLTAARHSQRVSLHIRELT
jgi:hypothetical protein